MELANHSILDKLMTKMLAKLKFNNEYKFYGSYFLKLYGSNKFYLT